MGWEGLCYDDDNDDDTNDGGDDDHDDDDTDGLQIAERTTWREGRAVE